jgi:hypothetical protein
VYLSQGACEAFEPGFAAPGPHPNPAGVFHDHTGPAEVLLLDVQEQRSRDSMPGLVQDCERLEFALSVFARGPPVRRQPYDDALAAAALIYPTARTRRLAPPRRPVSCRSVEFGEIASRSLCISPGFTLGSAIARL